MDVFLARQPIFDKGNRIFGYEILYRDGTANAFSADADQDFASGNALTRCFLNFGMDSLTNGTRAFVNFTSEFLKNDIATIFPKEQLVVEILETVQVDDSIIAACTALKDAGYTLAIDDFTVQPGYDRLIPLADIIKVDFKQSPPDEQRDIVRRYRREGLHFLAEKVETDEEHRRALDVGYDYFQGYFYARPEMNHTKKILPFAHTRQMLMQCINEPEPNYDEITHLIESDLAFSYEILRLVNSAYFAQRMPVTSVRRAVVMLGIQELRKWMYIIFLTDVEKGKPSEIVLTSMVRGRFMENLTGSAGRADMRHTAMTIGMFSLLDVLLECSMDNAIAGMNFSDPVRDVLCGKATEGFLAQCYQAVLSYEQGLWGKAVEIAGKFGVSADVLQSSYMDALRWVKQVYQGNLA